MRIVEVQEGSDAWRAWRQGGIGSSDAPVIAGVSRYLAAAELWRRKRSGTPPTVDNLALARGRALEPVARAEAARRLGCELRPLCVEHPVHPELRASLDGWCEGRALPVEIKCPTRALHAEAVAGRIPRRFLPQCLHLLLVTGATTMVYVSYHPDDRRDPLVLVELTRPAALCEQLARLERAFWQAVTEGEAPPPPLRLGLEAVATRRM